MKKILLILAVALVGCVDIEDKRDTRKVDQFECYKKAKELGAKAKWCERFDMCTLYLDGDTIIYKYKQ